MAEPTEVPPHTNPAPATAQTAIAARLNELFPSGVLPDPTQLRSGEMAAGDPRNRVREDAATGPAATTGPTGAPAATGTEATGAPAASTGTTGVSGTTGPSDEPTGPTQAASGPAESGPTQAQLDEAGKKMDIKAGTAFKHVRDENATLKQELAATKKELEAKSGATGPVADAAEVAELKAKVARYEGELAISRVEATDDFIKNISKPLAQATADMQAIATKYQVPAADLAAAMAVADPLARTDKLAELSANFNRMDVIRFDKLVGKIESLSEQKQSEITNAAEKWKTIQAQRDAESKQAASAFESNWKGALVTAAGKLESDGFFKLTGNAERDAEITKIQQTVQNLDVAKVSNEELAASLYKAYAFPLLLEEMSAALATVGEKDARIAKLEGSSARPAGGGQNPPPQSGPTGVAETASFQQVMREKLVGVLPG